MKFLAPAKINFTLKILNKRKDRYHNIRSIMQTVALYDEIYIKQNNKNTIEFSCDWSDIIIPGLKEINIKKNLGYISAIKFKEFLKKNFRTNFENFGAKIHIIKHIPSGAGLGGASSDAAEILKGLMKLVNIKLSYQTIKKICLDIGSDVLFFFFGGCCFVEGKGDLITPLNIPFGKKPLWILLVYPAVSVKTKKLYTAWDKSFKTLEASTYDRIPHQPLRFVQGSLCSVWNDFEKIIYKFYPELKKLKKSLNCLNADYISMTGTGSSFYAIFKNRINAMNSFNNFKIKNTWKKYIVPTL